MMRGLILATLLAAPLLYVAAANPTTNAYFTGRFADACNARGTLACFPNDAPDAHEARIVTTVDPVVNLDGNVVLRAKAEFLARSYAADAQVHALSRYCTDGTGWRTLSTPLFPMTSVTVQYLGRCGAPLDGSAPPSLGGEASGTVTVEFR